MGRLHRQKLRQQVHLEVWGEVRYQSRLRLMEERALAWRRELQRGAQLFPPGVQRRHYLRPQSRIITPGITVSAVVSTIDQSVWILEHILKFNHT